MNRLRDSLSPYLRQHADNPVEWYPWGEEAFAAAQRDDKPILLSVGYSACHWCHVMAHESFEDPETAALMNELFVSIKVDREERPDVDDIYMQATMIFNQGHGGWPMTVFLTPDGRPFHAGTYYPKDDGRGMMSFKAVMAAVNDAFRNRRDQVERVASEVAAGLSRTTLNIGGDDEALNTGLLEAASAKAMTGYDPAFGGLTRGQPKFPSPMNYEFLLNCALYNPALRERVAEVVGNSLRKMARGGIYDQIGGGFHRYSVDRYWLVPHFEKMLYDNAQLSRLYLHAWAATGDPFFRRIATEIYDYVLREMTAPEGGFYSTTDADSEGEEGKFFVWTPAEIRAALPPEQADAAIAYWGVTERGNFEGHTILNVPEDDDKVARRLGIDLETLHKRLAAARATLYEVRKQRVHPGLDDKILTAWNGMMLASLAEGGRLLNRVDYLEAAARNAEFLFTNLKREDRLLRSYKDGRSQFNGYLEDYANLIDGLIQLYMATFTPGYLASALDLAEVVLARFAAPDGGFFDTSDDHEALIARPRNLQDNATPSGNSMMATVLLQLAAYTGEARYDAAARAVLRQLTGAMQEFPQAFGQAMSAASMAINGIDEVAIIGDPQDPATLTLLEVVNEGYRPNLILALAESEPGDRAFPPLLAGRGQISGAPTAYVCRKFVCLQPVTDTGALAGQLTK